MDKNEKHGEMGDFISGRPQATALGIPDKYPPYSAPDEQLMVMFRPQTQKTRKIHKKNMQKFTKITQKTLKKKICKFFFFLYCEKVQFYAERVGFRLKKWVLY